MRSEFPTRYRRTLGAMSFIVFRKRRDQIDINAANQRFESMRQTVIYCLQSFGIGGDVLCHEIEELIECWIIMIAFSGTHQHHLIA